jgi:hypothetical protein
MAEYELRELGELKWFLGIRVVRDRTQRKIWLCQDSYIEKMAEKFHLQEGVCPKTPITTDEILPYEGKATPQEIFAYQQKVGSVNYPAVVTRPDISRTAQKLAEFLVNPSPAHSAAADRAIKYLYGTRTMAIEYGPSQTEAVFQCSSDAAYADDAQTRQSTKGYLFQLFGGPIDWRCTKQKTVKTSTTEAELSALYHVAVQLYWWQRFFDAIDLDLDEDLVINCDNLQTVRLMIKESPKLVTKLKHVDIHQHWLRQEVERQKLQIKWIATTEMPADGFTKALPRQKHEAFVRQLNLVDIVQILAKRQQSTCVSAVHRLVRLAMEVRRSMLPHTGSYGWPRYPYTKESQFKMHCQDKWKGSYVPEPHLALCKHKWVLLATSRAQQSLSSIVWRGTIIILVR